MEMQAIFSMKEKSFAHNKFWELEFLITFAIVWGLFVEDIYKHLLKLLQNVLLHKVPIVTYSL